MLPFRKQFATHASPAQAVDDLARAWILAELGSPTFDGNGGTEIELNAHTVDDAGRRRYFRATASLLVKLDIIEVAAPGDGAGIAVPHKPR